MIENDSAQNILNAALKEMESLQKTKAPDRSSYQNSSYVNNKAVNFFPNYRNVTLNRNGHNRSGEESDGNMEDLSKENQKLRQMIDMLSQDKQELSSDIIVLRQKLIHYETEILPRSRNGTPILQHELNQNSSNIDLPDHQNHSRYFENMSTSISPNPIRQSPRATMFPNISSQSRTMSRHPFDKYSINGNPGHSHSDNLIPNSKKSISLNELYHKTNNPGNIGPDHEDLRDQYVNTNNSSHLEANILAMRDVESRQELLPNMDSILDRRANIARTMSQSPKSLVPGNRFLRASPQPQLITNMNGSMFNSTICSSERNFNRDKSPLSVRESINERKISVDESIRTLINERNTLRPYSPFTPQLKRLDHLTKTMTGNPMPRSNSLRFDLATPDVGTPTMLNERRNFMSLRRRPEQKELYFKNARSLNEELRGISIDPHRTIRRTETLKVVKRKPSGPKYRINLPKADFAQWDRDLITAWLYDLGLGYIVTNARKCISKGEHLLKASKKDLEKELGIKNPLHLKKLLIHMKLNSSQEVEALESLNIQPKVIDLHESFNVETWLENIGLSNYYVNFDRNLIDGYVLDIMTIDDLLYMDITNEFHVTSLKRGIQVLRRINFDLNRYCARPAPENGNEFSKGNREYTPLMSQDNKRNIIRNNTVDPGIMWTSQHSGILSPKPKPHGNYDDSSPDNRPYEECISSSSNMTLSSSAGSGSMGSRGNQGQQNSVAFKGSKYTPEEVALWSQFMIIHWLKDNDLKEFAFSCRGKGLHGGIIIFEDRFTSFLFANILNIPKSKSLIRKHLDLKFRELVGDEIFERKQNLAKDCVPLGLSSKIKSKKKLFFGKKKKASENEYLVCPYEEEEQDYNENERFYNYDIQKPRNPLSYYSTSVISPLGDSSFHLAPLSEL